MSWKHQSFIGICACCYNRSLIFVLCFAISFRGYNPSSFPWFVNMRLQSSCLLVTTIVCTIVFETAIQFCLWLLLLLIAWCHKVALSCLIDTGVILKPWDWSATVCVCLDKDNLGPMFFKPWRFDWRLSIEHLIWDLMSVNIIGLPLSSPLNS
jgi:hypothetical protein